VVPLFVFLPNPSPCSPQPVLWAPPPYGIFFVMQNPVGDTAKGRTGMRRTTVATIAVVAVSAFAALGGRTDDRQGVKSFQLVYQSDTRGYYRPCG
jgi:hypothetical protein